MKIIDDFLSPSYADEIESILDSPNQEWYFNKNISKTEESKTVNYGFSYWILRPDGNFTASKISFLLQPFLCQVKDTIQKQTVCRCRLDMTVSSGTEVLHDPHVDMPGINNTTVIYYANKTDGDTVVYNETQPSDEYTIQYLIPPKKNRLVIFDGNQYHTGHSPLTYQNRILINSNFI